MNKPSFAGKRVLLLQGPVGPFFYNLAKDLRAQGATVFKFNFNAGDWLFYPRHAQSFRGDLAQWPAVLKAFLQANQIDAILLFGDCRPVHVPARDLARQLSLRIGVFEEGYLRPNHVTFECGGVNAYSSFTPQQALAQAAHSMQAQETDMPFTPVGNAFWHAALWGILYFFSAWLAQCCWNNALHHRRMTIRDAPYWGLSFVRKIWQHRRQRGQQQWLCESKGQQFFLAPLQVYNDAQIVVHSDYASVMHFIASVMKSYARALRLDAAQTPACAPASLASSVLVFKHHPMDRGHRDYGPAIARLAQRLGLSGRVLYLHDQHLPSLLKAARGVVVVNSTVGFAALQHGAPVKVCGRAMYDSEGLTFAGSLTDFWHQAHLVRPCRAWVRDYKSALLQHTQINGSFYRKLHAHTSQAGFCGTAIMAQRLWSSASKLPAEMSRWTCQKGCAAVREKHKHLAHCQLEQDCY